MNLDKAIYPMSVAARASGWELNTMRSYFKRGIFRYMEVDAAAESAGKATLLSARSVIGLAIARKLFDLGVSARDAFEASYPFTDFGSSGSIIGGVSVPNGPEREPGHLFDETHFITILRWRQDGYVHIEALSKKPQEVDRNHLYDIFTEPVVLCPINGIYHRALEALSLEEAA